MASIATNSVANTTTEPAIVKFAFTNLTVVGSSDKWTAKCRICKSVLSEKRGTTSAFTR